MNDLIKISYDGEQPTVSARDLHEGLEIKTALKTGFREWRNMAFLKERTLAQK